MAFRHERGTIQSSAHISFTREKLYQFCIPIMVLTTVFVSLRIYVRGYMTRTFGIEDWLIIPAYALFMVLSICAIFIGQSILDEGAIEHYPRLIKLTTSSVVVFIVDQIFIKLSVAAYFYRICEGWQRHVIVGTVSIFSMYNFAFAFVTVFQCGIPTIANLTRSNADGHCISLRHVIKPLLFAAVSLNTACDWVFVLASLPVLAKLRRMPKDQIICVCLLIFLATGASVLSLVRLAYLPGGHTDVLLLRHNQFFDVLSFIEAGTTIVTICMATLHPLFQACVRKKRVVRQSATSSPRTPPPSSEDPPFGKKRTEPTISEETSTEHSSLGRIGILPTIYDAEMGIMAQHNSPRLGYTTDWT